MSDSVRYRSKTHAPKSKTYKPNDYPAGSVPVETGWFDHEHAISKHGDNNRITVCRGGRREIHKS